MIILTYITIVMNYIVIISIKDIGRRIASETGESRAGEYLLQRLSVAVQRGLCGCAGGYWDRGRYI